MHELNQHKIAALLPQRRAQSNKGSYGSVAAAAGSLAYRGAAALCVEGALRTGAGLVYLAQTAGFWPQMPPPCASALRKSLRSCWLGRGLAPVRHVF